MVVCKESLWGIHTGSLWVIDCLHLVVGLKRKRGGGMWYSQRHYGWYIGAGGCRDLSSI